MLTPAVLFYDVVLFIHITAVVLAFGVVFTYPVLDGFLRRKHPGDLAALHRMQAFLTQRFITPMMVVVLVAGLYLALDRWSLGDPWISATFAILIVLFGLSGAVFGPAERRAAELAARDQRSGGGFSEEYEREAAKLARFGGLALLLVLVAIFLMTAKPGLDGVPQRNRTRHPGAALHLLVTADPAGVAIGHANIPGMAHFIARSDPETTVAWEGDRVSGTVQLASEGWSTTTAEIPAPGPPVHDPSPPTPAPDPAPPDPGPPAPGPTPVPDPTPPGPPPDPMPPQIGASVHDRSFSRD